MGAPAHDARLEADLAGGQTNRKTAQLFAKTEIICYTFSCSLDQTSAGRRRAGDRMSESWLEAICGGARERTRFFIWIRRNPLKSPDSDEENQIKPSYFAWFYLAGLGFAWICLAAKAEPRPRACSWQPPAWGMVQAGTIGALVFLSASMNSSSNLRWTFRSSGGVSASHWFNDTSA